MHIQNGGIRKAQERSDHYFLTTKILFTERKDIAEEWKTRQDEQNIIQFKEFG